LNAAVVGILAAAFITPVVTTGARTIADAVIAILGLIALMRFRTAPWIVAVATVILAGILDR